MPWKSKVHRPVARRPELNSLARRYAKTKWNAHNTPEWRQASKEFIKENPLCVECLEESVYEPSRVTDHVIPYKGDMDLFWDRSNWQALCFMHHNRKTAREDGGFGNAKR